MEFRPVNLAEIFGNIDAARANQAQMQNNAMMQERQRRQFAMEDAEVEKKRKIGDIYRNLITNVDGQVSFDDNRYIFELADVDPFEAKKEIDAQGTRKLEQAKLKNDLTKSDLENRKATSAYIRDLVPSVTDQASYDAFLQESASLGANFVKTAPREFNPDYMRSVALDSSKFVELNTPKYEKVDLGGKIQIIDTNPNTNPSIKGTSLDKTATIGERESMRHNRVQEGISGAQLGVSRERLAFDKAGGGASKAPAGYRFLQDGSLEAIKGGPADIKAGELGAKTEARKNMQLGTTANTIEAVDTALKQAGFLETGMTGAAMSKIPGSDAYNLRRTAETIKANLGFNELQAMREASPTGGALGAIAVQELTALQSTIANIDPNQSQDQLKANLKKVRKHVNAWRKTLGGQEIPEVAEQTQTPRGGSKQQVLDDADKILGIK